MTASRSWTSLPDFCRSVRHDAAGNFFRSLGCVCSLLIGFRPIFSLIFMIWPCAAWYLEYTEHDHVFRFCFWPWRPELWSIELFKVNFLQFQSKSTKIGIYPQKHQLFKITFMYNSPLINASKAVGISKVVMPSNAIFIPRRERHYVASPRGNAALQIRNYAYGIGYVTSDASFLPGDEVRI